VRVAVTAGPGRTALLQELAEDGSGHAAPTLVNDFPAAVADYERAGLERGETVRWVWADTSTAYPSLLRAGIRVDRCHDVALTEALLLARGGAPAGPVIAQPTVIAPAQRALTVQRALAGRRADPGLGATGQATLFGPAEPGLDDVREVLDALVAVHADQLRQIAADAHPGRFGLLAAVESAGGLAAAEMRLRGMPWRVDVHDALLAGLLGPRPGPGLRPPRLAELAAQISAAFGGRQVNPESPAQLL
jgi:DNA polymerase-1